MQPTQNPNPATAKGVTWRQPLAFILATMLSTVLAIWAVVAVPPSGSAVPGVSGLYLAAAIYVPLALWFGIWGCLAGYVSCIFVGLYAGYSLSFTLVWSLADFFEGFVPLLIYRSLKMKPVLDLKRPNVTYGLNGLLALTMVASGAALAFSLNEVFVATFAVALALLIAQAVVEDKKTWLVWLGVGVVLASLVSGVFGVGALAAFGTISWAAFPTVFFGWAFGDIIVLATVGTILTVLLTPYIMRSGAYVRGFFA